jgi:hypothetical protein
MEQEDGTAQAVDIIGRLIGEQAANGKRSTTAHVVAA